MPPEARDGRPTAANGDPANSVSTAVSTSHSVDDARRLTDRIGLLLGSIAGQLDKLAALITEAQTSDVAGTLGYPSWTAYVAAEFKDNPLRLDRDDRRELVTTLAGEGMSTRAIAPVVGVDQKTVSRDLVASGEADGGADASPVQGLDGKSYAKQKRPVAEREPVAPVVLTLRTHEGVEVPYPQPKAKATFNPTNEHISWAAWSWNPVTGCLHGCDYCYARELATKPSFAAAYPVGFTPLFHPERLDAPANTKVPASAAEDPRKGRVFVCSMADLYGQWIPDEWIDQVHAACIANPQWDYLTLTKFPKRYTRVKLPSTAWVGTSVDEQKRVRIAEDAFRNLGDVRVKWLSLEPLLAPLQFSDLSMFDWIVIGSQTQTVQPTGIVDAFAPPFKWVARIVAQAEEAGARVYLKPNLLGVVGPQSPGMVLPQEEPRLGERGEA